MDSYSSGERFNVKTRKPYTITKQRERWTEDEHNSFLEALKLYGRAWQKIEEHIGTKTAVQIRSHAQKFFTKLEKEAVAKGVPIRQALDMEIPPPRPKRKPNYPYPRKTGPKNVDASLVSSMQSGIQILDLERKPPPETTSHEEKLENAEANDEVEIGIEGPSLSQEAPSENENSIPRSVEAGVFREFIPALEEVVNHDETNESFITVETRKHQSLDEDGGIKHTTITSNTSFLHQKIIHGQSCDKLGNVGTLSINDMRGVHSYPRHVPVQVVEGKNSIPPETSFQESTLENPNLFVNIAAASATTGHASTSSGYQTVPAFHPLYTPICDNQDNHTSFLQVSSTISSLIVSSLLQNPAAHAAARFAATFWHPPNTEASSGDSSSRDQLSSETPSMAAIAAATVAAATAWWAAHGLLPVCTPFYPGNSSTSPFPYGTPINGTHARVTDNGREKAPLEGVLQEKKMDAKKPEGKPAYLSSSEDSDGERDKKLNTGPSAADTKEMAPVEESNVRKQVDRSSCGSNTTSSSEIETDALEKHAKEKEETKGPDVNVPCNDSIFRRSSRNTISPYESWKEVSEEGRLAFQALFSREVLPQSFTNGELDLNRLSCSSQEAGEKNERKMEEGLLRMGLGNVKLNAHHTGFKPYKRCSIEAKESNSKASTGTQNDEKGPKRMRLEAEATT